MSLEENDTNSKYAYYIMLEGASYQFKRISTQPAIIKTPYIDTILVPRIESQREIEGPFLSLNALKAASILYRTLLFTKPKHAQKIANKKNIKVVTPIKFRSDYDPSFKETIWRILQHSISGDITNGEVTGIHYYDGKIKTIRILEERRSDDNGVWEAIVQYYNSSSGEWKTKSNASTFFPKKWDINTLIVECEHAFHNKTKTDGRECVYKGLSKSGVPIVFIIDTKETLKSVYPELTT